MTDLLECSVCLQTYDDPQLLTSCGHTFCRTCVESLPRRICPICRGPIASRNGFQPNFALRLLLQDVADSSAVGSVSRPETQSRTQGDGVDDDMGVGHNSILRTFSGAEMDVSGESDSKLKALCELGLPWGLARQVQEEDAQIALRIFLLDNSGSTANFDGRKLVDNRMVDCSRWEETRFMAMEQARWNARIGTPCEFLLLNPPCARPRGSPLRDGIDFLRVTPDAEESMEVQCEKLQALLDKTQPCGPTPLSERIGDIHARIAQEQEQLAHAGQRVVLIIATDGVPSGTTNRTLSPRNDLIRSLRKIAAELPVHLVIRLTTDDDSVVDFYNKIDEELEFPLEVLDDIESEAKEIAAKGNGWLTYSPLIHMIREHGTFVKLFDLLDERCLAAPEAMVLARLMLQEDSACMLPRDAKTFCLCAAEQVKRAPLVYNPLTRRLAPCVNVSALHARLIPLSQRLLACCAQRRQGQSSRRRESWWASWSFSPQGFVNWLTTPSYNNQVPEHID